MSQADNLAALATNVNSSGVLQPASGGTGTTSTAAAPFALKGANSDITSITGLTTPLSAAQGGTGVTTSTGTGNNVLSNSPTLVTPALGTPSSGTLTSCTGLPLTTGVTGTLPLANGGTGTTNTVNTVVAGTGISISTSGTQVTVSTSGGGAGQLQDALYLSGTSTWTAPTGVTRVRVTVIGGGGAGGAGGNNGSDGASGGVGGLAVGSYTVTPGTGYTVTVGGGGSRSGGSGGTSSFGGFLSATGGGGGQGNGGSSGGNGNGSGGTIRNRNIGFNSGSPWSGESTQWNIATQSFSIGSQYGAGQNGGGGPVFDGSGQPGGGGIGGLVYIQWVGS